MQEKRKDKRMDLICEIVLNRLDTKDKKAERCFLMEDCKVCDRPYYVVVDAETKKLLTKVNIPTVEAELNVDEDVIFR